MIKFTFYNLSVKIETDDETFRRALEKFVSTYYTIKAQAYGVQMGSAKAPQDKKFYSSMSNANTYHLHTNQLKHLIEYMETAGIPLRDVRKENLREYEHVTTSYKPRDHWVMRPEQKGAVDFILDNPVRSKILILPTGSGKALTLDSKIKTPYGWTTMGEVKLGDVITARDGSPTTVTGVFPQGESQVYRVTFLDGRYVDCNDEHLWKVFNVGEKDLTGRWSVINTAEIKRLLTLKHPRLYIPLIEPEVGTDIPLPLDPYLLGSLLGNGCLRNSSNIGYSSRDHDHIEKFVPKIYLSGSLRQRVALLQGLMDTDGTVDINSSTTYSTSSEQLAKDVQYLVRSIGGLASIHVKKEPKYTYRGQRLTGRTAYIVNIRHPKPSTLFSLERKKSRTNDNNQYASILKLRITSVVPIGSAQTQCISVDNHEKLFITNDFITTHNTAVSLYALAKLQYRLGVVILPTYVDKWVKDIAEVHETTTHKVMVIQGSKALRGIITMANEGTITSEYFVFSSRTLQEYITAYEDSQEDCVNAYGCAPIDLFPKLGIGAMLVDETHQHFHAIYKILIHTNVKFQLGLSATLMSDDNVVTRMHKTVYPESSMFTLNVTDKYTDVYALRYSLPAGYMKYIRTSTFGSSTYSHTAFEQSVMKFIPMRNHYYKLIDNTLIDFYIDKYEKDDKCLIFVATVKMATALTEMYSAKYPTLKVMRYCEQDPFENLYKADIIVTTVISAGTAVDIPNLRVVVQTVCISSSVANIQTLGRLRKLKDGKDTRFCYIYADNLNKQRGYHNKRVELFASRVANHKFLAARFN